MTEPTQPEGTAEQASAELPIPKLESVSPGSVSSGVDTKALAKEVAALLKPDFEKVAQSTKDKRIAALEKRLGTSDLAELEEQGVQIPDNVKLEYRLRNLEQGRQPESPSQTPTSQGSGANLTAQDVSEVVKRFNLDANDAEVIEKLRGTYRNRDHFEATLAGVAISRINKPSPSPAESSSMQTPPSGGSEDVNVKIARLAEMQKAPSQHRAEIKALTKELDARGWK